METLKFDLGKKGKGFKVLNGVCGGPWHKRHAVDQPRSNFNDYKAARFPYSRNHDSAMCSIYGGPYSHDINCIFPNFDADVNDPSSYEFACTDESILVTLDAGTETFFRLGQSIEHQIKKYGVRPPKDFKKWAEICAHIIMHYNYGWADGHHLGIKHWEIWNEADLDDGKGDMSRTWCGTREEFFDLYAITSKLLKSRFPEIKIGGPGYSGNRPWAEEFLAEMKKREVPIDFFSFHVYGSNVQKFIDKSAIVRELLDSAGYTDTEIILDEWNYVKGWDTKEDFIYSLKTIHSVKGASFVAANIMSAQKNDNLDMMLYYDTRPSAWNGVFDFYTAEPLKSYYPLAWYSDFYDIKSEIRCENEPENIYSICGVDDNGKLICILTNFSDDDAFPSKDIRIDFGKIGKYEVYVVDEDKDGELVCTTEKLEFTLKPFSIIKIKEI